MLRLALVAAVAVVLAMAMTTAPAAARGVAPAAGAARPMQLFVGFRSRWGFGSGTHFGGSRSPFGYGYGRRSPSLLHRIVRTAIWLYILHLFFSHGGFSILLWIIVIGLALSLVRRRRRRYDRRAQSFWP